MRSYYRCSLCHSRVVFEVSEDGSDTVIRCSGGYKGIILNKKYVYRCVSYNWFERSYLSVMGMIRTIKRLINEE